MTPFEARGWTKDMKFAVIPAFDKGDVVTLLIDDATHSPLFVNEEGIEGYLPLTEVQPLEAHSITKHTVFDLKLTGEELVYLAVGLDRTDLPPAAAKLDNSIYCKVTNILLEFGDAKAWVWSESEDIADVINRVFPPQETPEQKQYKELLAQREALDVQLAQLSQKLNLRGEIGGTL